MTQFRQSDQQVATQFNADHITIEYSARSLTEEQRRQNRLRMLQRIQRIWIAGVLEPAVQGSDLLQLEWRAAPDAVATPFGALLQESELGRTSNIAAHTCIVDVYDQADGELLVLGEPGSGKTMLLLELTRALLERAYRDENQPIPVVFPLSSWATTRRPLAEWLASELYSRYQIPLPLATFWMATNQVLPLLDGLDEVAALHRGSCVEAINSYRRTHGLLGTVVCSRQSDYLRLAARLLLRAAIVVQPLTPDKIVAYLDHGGTRLGTLRQALDEDSNLRALSRTPLLLNVLAVSYNDDFFQEFTATGSLAMKREHVFDAYVQRMLSHRTSSTRYRPEQTLHWLCCLAQYLKRQSQTVFYIEQMQPDWLTSTRSYRWWTMLLPGMLMGICVCLIMNTLSGGGLSLAALLENTLLGAFIGALLSGETLFKPASTFGFGAWSRCVSWLLPPAILLGAGIGLDEGLSSGQVFSLIHGLVFGAGGLLLPLLLSKHAPEVLLTSERHGARKICWRRLLRSSWLYNGLLLGVTVGLSFGLSDGLIYGLRPDGVGLSSRLHDALDNGLTNGWIIEWNAVLKGTLDGRVLVGLLYGLLSYGLNFGFVGALLSLLLSGRRATVQLSDRLLWSWSHVGRCLCSLTHLRTTLWLALCVALVDGLSDGPVVSVSAALMVALIYWLLFGFFQGIPSTMVGDQQRLLPNQGVHRSALNGFVLGLMTAGVVLLIFLGSGLAFVLLNRAVPSGSILFGALKNGVLTGLCSGLLIGFFKGGQACLCHYVLRFLLWRRRIIPWNYIRFLDDAHELLLLRKVGGGYIFLHRLFLDYFAALESSSDVSGEGYRSETLYVETLYNQEKE